MDKDNSDSVSIEEIVDYMLLHGRFDLGTKSQRDFSTAVLRKLGNDHMNKAEFEVSREVFVKESFDQIHRVKITHILGSTFSKSF